MNKVLIVCTVLLAVMSCEKESPCVKCTEAIDHMASKISQNNCNPNLMENAWNRIKEDCPGSDFFYVGYLAEDCAFGYQGRVGCTEMAYGAQVFDNANRPIRVRYKNGTPEDTMQVILSDNPTSFIIGDKSTLTLGQTIVMEYTGYKDFGAQVSVLLYNTHTDDTAAVRTQELRYDRTNEWSLMREIEIQYDPNSMAYLLKFIYW